MEDVAARIRAMEDGRFDGIYSPLEVEISGCKSKAERNVRRRRTNQGTAGRWEPFHGRWRWYLWKMEVVLVEDGGCEWSRLARSGPCRLENRIWQCVVGPPPPCWPSSPLWPTPPCTIPPPSITHSPPRSFLCTVQLLHTDVCRGLSPSGSLHASW